MARNVAQGYELDKDAHRITSQIAAKRGMKKKEIVRRVMIWLSRQSPLVQRVALLDVDEGMEARYADALEEIARNLRAAPTPSLSSPAASGVPPGELETTSGIVKGDAKRDDPPEKRSGNGPRTREQGRHKTRPVHG